MATSGDVARAIERRIALINKTAERALMAWIYEEAEAIMTDSKEHYVPVDTGALKGSGFVEKPTLNGTAIRVALGYGGPATGYALVVHERLGVHHPVGSAKYLEIPILNAKPSMGQRGAARLAAAFRALPA